MSSSAVDATCCFASLLLHAALPGVAVVAVSQRRSALLLGAVSAVPCARDLDVQLKRRGPQVGVP